MGLQIKLCTPFYMLLVRIEFFFFFCYVRLLAETLIFLAGLVEVGPEGRQWALRAASYIPTGSVGRAQTRVGSGLVGIRVPSGSKVDVCEYFLHTINTYALQLGLVVQEHTCIYHTSIYTYYVLYILVPGIYIHTYHSIRTYHMYNAKTEKAFFSLENQGEKGSRSALARLVNPTLGASQRGKLTMKSDDFSVGHCVIR